MKNKMLLSIFKSVMVFIFALLIIPINTHAADWFLSNVELSNIEIDENNKITGYTVHFYIDGQSQPPAISYVGIQKVKFKDSYDDNDLGDFTNSGEIAYNKNFNKLTDVINDTDFMKEYEIISFSPKEGEGFPSFGSNRQIDREFTNLNIQLYENEIYYVYLWTNNGNVYPDALIGTVELDGNGKIKVNNSNETEEKNYYTLKYETNNGNKIASVSIIEDGKAVEPTNNPTREGYEFIGWYADVSLETPFDFDTNMTNNTTIYAKWKKNLSFKGYDGAYDKDAHSIIIDGDTEGYTITYSLDGITFDLTEAPKYTTVGNYTIYYKATKEGHEDLTGSVKVNITEPNPQTGDNIILWFITGILSCLGLIIIFTKNILLNRNNTRKI